MRTMSAMCATIATPAARSAMAQLLQHAHEHKLRVRGREGTRALLQAQTLARELRVSTGCMMHSPTSPATAPATAGSGPQAMRGGRGEGGGGGACAAKRSGRTHSQRTLSTPAGAAISKIAHSRLPNWRGWPPTVSSQRC